ncbi:MAG: hypothetical protein SF123_05480 [Chloroflexota bacterium]|nr:hypothetical protein [Chloroflexota bacterium]
MRVSRGSLLAVVVAFLLDRLSYRFKWLRGTSRVVALLLTALTWFFGKGKQSTPVPSRRQVL